MKLFFTKQNIMAFIYCLVLEAVMVIRYFLGADTKLLLALLIFLILFDAAMRKLQVEIKSPYHFMLFLMLARYYDWAVYIAMAIPVLTFTTQLRQKE